MEVDEIISAETKLSEIDSESDTLTQHGVKGMKWGVRRTQAELDAAAGRKPASSSRSERRKEAKSLSDDELKSRIRRIEQERRYVELTSKPSTIERGAREVNKILANSARNIATQQLTNYGNAKVNELLNSKKN